MGRRGADLDPEQTAALDGWLKARVAGIEGEPRVSLCSGGASNWTYRVQYDSHDLILRRPPAGTKAKSAHDMGREYRIQEALRPAFPFVPEMVASCDDASVIGSEFYLMQREDGLIPRRDLPREVDWTPPLTRQLCLSVIDTLVALHRVDATAAGLDGLGRGAGYVRRQVDGWSDRYVKARTWNVPRFTRVMDWLKANAPDDVRTCVIHNDYRLDNVVLARDEPTRVVAVLDWEMATLGDPLMDLGGALAYWVQADDDPVMRLVRRQPTHVAGMLTRREVVDRYCAEVGLDPGRWAFYEVFGLFRLAVIVQQIYYRHHHGQSRSPAFRNFWLLVAYLRWRCGRRMRSLR